MSDIVLQSDICQALKGKSILITGAGGLIGTVLTQLLLEADRQYALQLQVYALGRRRAALEERFRAYADTPALHFLTADVTEPMQESVSFDYIVQAASPAHPLAYSQTPVDVMKANLLGTMNMLELAKRCGARLLFISSGEIYGISDDPNSAFQESDYGFIEISNPRSCYPESKRAAETLCASYHAQYGVETVVARLCHVYGPTITDKNSRADAQFLRKAVIGEDIVMKSPGTQTRSFCYVKDAAMGLVYILTKGNAGEAYNIANRASIATVRQYAQTMAKVGGVGIRDEFPSEEEARGYSVVSRAVLDAGKLEALGWKPQYDLEQGLDETVRLCKQAHGA